MAKMKASLSHAELEDSLRDTVAAILKSGSPSDLTVKRVRAATERTWDLPADFFKQEEWKEKSKQIIEAAAAETPVASQSMAGNSPVRLSRGEAAHGTKEEAQEEGDGPEVKKDSPTSLSTPREQINQKSLNRGKNGKKVEKDHQTSKRELEPGETTTEPAQASEAESDMSELIDDSPQPKKRKKSKDERVAKGSANVKHQREKQTAKQSAKQSVKQSSKSKSQQADADPDLEEIKRLQGWLIKCGIRKMWFKELAPFEGSKAKIRHLKDMLADVGLTGRYSLEKAMQIRETRELKADLEAVQDGAKHWGATEPDDEESESRRPKRRLAKGFASLDFLGDEGEETD